MRERRAKHYRTVCEYTLLGNFGGHQLYFNNSCFTSTMVSLQQLAHFNRNFVRTQITESAEFWTSSYRTFRINFTTAVHLEVRDFNAGDIKPHFRIN